MSDWLNTYKQHLAAQTLSMTLHEASVTGRYDTAICEYSKKRIDKEFAELAARLGYRIEPIQCSYCDATGDLRKHHDTGGHAPQDYVCASCFTPETDGPAFDDLASVEASA